MVYVLLFLSIFTSVLKLRNSGRNMDLKFETISFHIILLNGLIQPSHNLILIALQLSKSFYMRKLLKNCESLNEVNLLYLHLSVAQSNYFSQGNSNSLNTVQVSSGFVGLNEVNLVLSGILIFIATYYTHFVEFCNFIQNISLIQR